MTDPYNVVVFYQKRDAVVPFFMDDVRLIEASHGQLYVWYGADGRMGLSAFELRRVREIRRID